MTDVQKKKKQEKQQQCPQDEKKCNNVALWSAEGQVFEHLVATVGEGGLWS